MRERLRTAVLAGTLSLGVLSAGAISTSAAAAPAQPTPPASDKAPAADKAKPDAEPKAEDDAAQTAEALARFAGWVLASRDNQGLPFVVIDKVSAQVLVFDADGRPIGAAPALIGLAPGDDSVPGIGDRELAKILPEERTTPAGRFVAAYGPAAGGEQVLWVDYETAVSLHGLQQVTLTDPREKRLQRLRTPTPLDNRVTYGCINVPDAFYEEVVRPTFTGTEGVVYVLPDTRPLQEVFPTFETQLASKKSDKRGGIKAFFKRLF